MKYLIKKVVPVEISQPVQGHEPIEVEVDGVKETLLRSVTTYEKTTVNTLEDVDKGLFDDIENGLFEELPAPAVTLGGRLLALKNATGFEHIAVEAPAEEK